MTANFVIRLYKRRRRTPILDLAVNTLDGHVIEPDEMFKSLTKVPTNFKCGFEDEEMKVNEETIEIIESDFKRVIELFDAPQINRSYLKWVEHSIG